MHKAWGIAIPGLLLVGAALLRVADPAPIQAVRNFVFDNYQRLEPPPYNPDLPVRIADIDEKSLAKFGQWPWSRSVLAKLVDRLRELGAAVIAFDVLLSEPDRTGPRMIAANLPSDPAFDAARAQMVTLPDPDEQLAAAMSAMPTVLGFALLGEDPQRPQSRPQPIGGFAAAGDSPIDFVPSFDYVVAALPNLQTRAAGNGAVNAVPDQDGVIRRVPLLLSYLGDWNAEKSPADALMPTLGLEAIRVALQSSSYNIRSSGAQTERWGSLFAAGIGALKIFNTPIMLQTDRGGELILRDTGHQPQRYISIADLFNPDFPPDAVAGRIILIGTSVEGLKDIQTTPRAARMPGVEVHAQTIEQIFDTSLNGTIPLQRPFWSDAAETAYLVVFGLLVIGLASSAGALAGLAVAVLSVAAAGGGSWYLFHERGWLVDPLYPAGTALILVMAATTVSFLRTEREKRLIRSTFSMYLSPEMVDQLAERPELAKLGGENREITVMFSDIRGFTKLSEGLDPQELTHVINAFLTPMTKLIQQHNGTIDKYIGDCIMAFWNAPLDVPHHAREAVRTAVEMRRTLKRLNEQFAVEATVAGRAPVKLRAGVGLNTGIGCVGNMGSEERLAYSALGDTVNIASRLESLSPAYFVDLVLGEETAADAADFALLELDQVKVKGKAVPIRIFTCLGTEAYAARPEYKALRAAHDRMLAAYRRQDWDAAEAARDECRVIAPERLHPFYALYGTRIGEFRADPPGADWDGVYVAKSKTG
ncbi:CHASE2 domain-containing protein [Dongia sedimenti]|uniref:Adenylate/guanylate cyclase domain-containing protein n=1 Tax=Dongia sedimenti TaxID=3064282 RepID=A0ABU0YNV4_9PROT|nr:adenylate/guanylate cyclase domain-containing protein [Rhodospirillaceae bacterium R-7]